jgi:nucleoside phosphorylase
MEKILCAAVWYDDGEKHIHQPKNVESGFVVAGRRHHNCFATVTIIADFEGSQDLKKKSQITQGFITSLDRFVDRAEAAKIAKNAGQVASEFSQLISEHLY